MSRTHGLVLLLKVKNVGILSYRHKTPLWLCIRISGGGGGALQYETESRYLIEAVSDNILLKLRLNLVI